jgi:L-ascorbate metabolism protein UlaG (beta-lactamase superfamily)
MVYILLVRRCHMKRSILLAVFLIIIFSSTGGAEMEQKIDTIKTDSGDLEITFVGHGTLMFAFDAKIIHVDPWSTLADYSLMPKADIVLITHQHRDHLDTKAVEQIRAEKTSVVLTEICAEQVDGGIVMKNGDTQTVAGLKIEAVPAYNIVNMRSKGVPYHPKGEGNGYVITLGGKRIYIAGDTENIPEMRGLGGIDVAFLPMNLPYTMTPKMVADAAKAFKPKRLYPYHYGSTDTSEIVELLKDVNEIEVLIR